MRFLILLSLMAVSPLAFGQTALIDSLERLAAAENKDEQTLKAYQLLVNEYSRTNLVKAKRYVYEGIASAKERQLWLLLSGFYSQLVSLHQNTGKTDSAEFYLNTIQTLTQTNFGSDSEKVLANYYSAAGLFYKKQGNYEKALPFLLKALALAKKVSTPESAAGQSLNVGNTYMNIGSYDKALLYHLRALKLFEDLGNKKGQSFCYQSIAEDFIEMEKYRKALGYVIKSLQLKKELNDKRGIGNALSAMGRIYLGLKKFDAAFAYLTQGLQITKELQLKGEEAKILLSLGLLLMEKKETASAVDYYGKGKELAVAANDSVSISIADRKMADLQKNQQAKRLAEKKLEHNLHRTKAFGNKKEELSIYKTLSDFYARDGEAEKSLLYTRKYYEGKDSLLSREVQLEIGKLEEQYKHEKKEAEIALLKKDQQLIQTALKREKETRVFILVFALLLFFVALLLLSRFKVIAKAKRLVEMEKVRNTIAKDLHDDIGSTLSSIHIMSTVLLQQAQKGVSDLTGLQKIKDHSAAIMERMSDIVWAINPYNDTGEKMLYKMKEFAAEILEPLGICYTFIEKGHFNAVKIDSQKRRDLFFIYKEAINNAAKYSQCKHLDIVLSLKSNTIELLVKDDGTGFDLKSVKKGNGLKNLNERSSAAGGLLTLTTNTGEGTSVQLQVPIT